MWLTDAGKLTDYHMEIWEWDITKMWYIAAYSVIINSEETKINGCSKQDRLLDKKFPLTDEVTLNDIP